MKRTGSPMAFVLVLVLLGGSQGCSGGQSQPLVCPIPSPLLAAAPAIASAAQQAPGVVQDVQEAVADQKREAVILAARTAIGLVEVICGGLPAGQGTVCFSTLGDARAIVDRADATTEQVCGALALVEAALPPERAPKDLAAAREVCR